MIVSYLHTLLQVAVHSIKPLYNNAVSIRIAAEGTALTLLDTVAEACLTPK